MDKEKLIQKLKIKDYNKELEEVLLNKPFSKITKNLLSSMLYKVENSYEDYKKVKVEVPSKKELLEEIIRIVGNDPREIEITKPTTEENLIPEDRKSVIIKEEQKIIVYQNELALLKAIYEINTNRFNNKSEDLKENAFFSTLNEGEIIAKSEIIRDFDGWSWNVLTTEIENYISNIIYQYIVFLIGYNTLNENKNSTKLEIETILRDKYKSSIIEKILKFATQASIINYIEKNSNENKVLKSSEKQLKNELALMSDKKTYIENIANEKKKIIKEIEKIDKYIYDDLLLKKEYIKQNEKLPQEQRVFSLSDFSEKIQEQRDFLEEQIKTLTEKLKPKNFIKEKNKIEKELDYIKDLDLKDSFLVIQEFINVSLKAINTQIEKLETKKEVIDKIYILRYLKHINVDRETKAGDLCKKQFEKVERNLVTIGCNLKSLNIFSQDIEENYKIYKNIFNTKIIDLESAYIEISKENVVKIYDENSLEKEEKYGEFKELTVKYNKKTRLFI